jgi:hypothetical protein
MSSGVQRVDQFLTLLKKSPTGPIFNPWWQTDSLNDIGPIAPPIRRRQLREYLSSRLGSASVAIIGEALGYRGGHFTGIAMTSERILLGGKELPFASRDLILPGIMPRRTSKAEKCSSGFSEPTATIVWSALAEAGLGRLEFVLWNAFPWHSFAPRIGMLSNRMPTKLEREAGLPVLRQFLSLFSFRRVIALGKIASEQLQKLGVPADCVRHPASGGARLFRQQISALLK